MPNILTQRATGAPNTIIDLRALRGRITHLDYALTAELKKIVPGQQLSEPLVRQLAEYCAGAAYLEVNDPNGRFARRGGLARLLPAFVAAVVAEVDLELAA